MLRKIFRKKSAKNNEVIYSEIPHNKDMELIGANIKSILKKNSDAIFRDVFICGDNKRPVTLVFIDGLVDSKGIADDILRPLIENSKLCEAKNNKDTIDLIKHGAVYFPDMKVRDNINDTLNDMLNAGCALIFDSEKTALTFAVKGFEKRGITEPTSENIVKGAKDAFVEALRINTATVRRKIKTQKLVVEQTKVGRQTETQIGIIYIDGIANSHLVDEVKRRIDNIEIDGVIEAGFVEEYIIDNKYTAFPLVGATERPDRFCTAILEGRVGIIIDGLPTAYIAPVTVQQLLRTMDDYSQNYFVVSALRLLRYLTMLLTVFLPGFYIAVTTFHQEMIPSELAQTIASSKEGVPYPSFIEVFLMLIAFEILLEAGLRLPKTIGQAVSIVGALVVGEAAVNAKLISPAVVVVIAITAISSFTMPNQDFSNALRLWRFVMAITSSMMGIFGISIGAVFLIYHLASIETFGVPYLSPYVASEGRDLGDSIIRIPLRLLKKRPYILRIPNERRQK
ncbi:spore germination protein [Acetivibrio cellulolyticus]|uniref:spore germination protein n=1 Tax=Acetivibrio cellulolyticus TaxID=35830 RepID=UPI0001E2C71E|nr:spore germination protein [Acetivibrio cellulolyticus]